MKKQKIIKTMTIKKKKKKIMILQIQKMKIKVINQKKIQKKN